MDTATSRSHLAGAGPPHQRDRVKRATAKQQNTPRMPASHAPLSATQLEKRERLFAGLYFLLGLIGVIVCAWALRQASLLAAGQ